MTEHEELKQKCEALAVLIATGKVLPTQTRTDREWAMMATRTAIRHTTPRLMLNK